MSNQIPEIDLNKTDAVATDSVPEIEIKGAPKMKKNKKVNVLGILLIVIMTVVIGLSLAIYFPLQGALSSVKEIKIAAKEVYEAAKNQNIQLTEEKLKNTRNKLKTAKTKVSVLGWTSFLPVVGEYYKDANHLINAGFYGLDSADIIVASIKPYADLLGLKGEGTFTGGTAEERIRKAVETMDKVTPNLAKILEKMSLIRKEIDQINYKKYPDSFAGLSPKAQLGQAKELIDQADIALKDARPLLELLPSLLGQPDEKKYLVLFQNDKELRSTGGFITAYAIFRVEKGKINVEGSDDIYKLDDAKTKKVAAPTPILKYLPLVPYWNLRDSNISPDFYVSMQNFEELYASVPGKIKYTGIIAIDTQFLVKIMDVLGPIPVYGTEFTTKIIPQCNCPQVIYELESFADKPVGYARGSRKDIIGALMGAIMHKALSSSPKQYWGPLFQAGMTSLNEKHVLVYLKDEKAQKAVESLNIAGRLREYEGDYLHINDTNFAGAKSNMYVREFVEQKIEIASDGTITNNLTIDYKNPQPPSDCNLEHGELCLNGLLRNWLRIYVPNGSQLIESRGSEVKMTTGMELGKTVFEGFLTVRPLGSSRIVLKYQLPFKYKNGVDYRLLIQKQPGTEGHEYNISANGKKIDKFNLNNDKEVKFRP